MLRRVQKFILAFMAVLLSYAAGSAVSASSDDEPDVCAPFQNGKVDSTVLQRMLQAADSGYLYRIKEDSSRVGFCVNSVIGKIEGHFEKFKGGFTMSVDPNEQALFLIDTGSVVTDGIFVESMIRSESFLDSRNHPEMLFVSTGFYWVNQDEAVLIGDLTIRGVTKKVGLHVEISRYESEIGDYKQHVKVKASTRIRRSEYGILSMSPMLSDEIDLCMMVEAVRYAV